MSFNRTYSIVKYPKHEKKIFNFLIKEYGFKIIIRNRETFNFITIYEKNDIRIILNYDIREQRFIFKIIHGKNTPVHSDRDNSNIKMFWDLFQYFDTNFDYKKTQPDETQYLDSLKLNADLLQKYGNKLLKGEEWYW